MTSRPPQQNFASEGFVLVAVLWMLAALAALVSIYSAYTINTASASHLGDDRVQAEASIRSAVEFAVFRQLAAAGSAPDDHFNIRLGRTAISVRLIPETARIDLNAAPEALLVGLFSAAGEAPARAQFLTDRVLGWRTKAEGGHSAEAQFYASRRLAYAPRQAPFENVLELALLPEFSPQLVERLLPMVTVFSGHSKIDAASADADVLSALPGMTPAIFAAVMKARAKGASPEDILALFGATKEYVSSNASEATRAKIAVDFDNGRQVHAEVVFRPSEDDKEPYEILYWRDDFDGPASSA